LLTFLNLHRIFVLLNGRTAAGHFRHACKFGPEGLISKRCDRPYRGRPSKYRPTTRNPSPAFGNMQPLGTSERRPRTGRPFLELLDEAWAEFDNDLDNRGRSTRQVGCLDIRQGPRQFDRECRLALARCPTVPKLSEYGPRASHRARNKHEASSGGSLLWCHAL
jgi:hypothetical protein